jgi:DNA-binding MarR family transcriptional regulator
MKRCLSDNLKEFKIPLKEWALLGFVADAGPKGVRNTAVARHFSVEMPVVTKVVTNGVKIGILRIESDPKDKRAQRIIATPDGLK